MPDKIPLGPPLPLSDEDLDKAAEITDADIEAARLLWRQAVDPEIADLLDAVEETDAS
jgi:hypothetical protein